MTSKTSSMWGGRFGEGPAAAVQSLQASIAFDWRLVAHDLWQNRVYAQELGRIGILSAAELAALDPAFTKIEQEIRDGTFPFRLELEDVHLNLEARLTDLAGDAGKRIHTGRSRNDQVATVFRLWLRDALDILVRELRDCVAVTLDRAVATVELPIPGYTHLQRAQVVSFGHHLHAYAEMLLRDLDRACELRKRINQSPLGSGALAGSPYPLDRARLASELRFAGPTRNSMDAVGDRDFALEFLHWAALVGVHLSRWAEDIILWASQEFGWIRIPDAWATGSSIMPQKKNPDVAELARGKSGRLIGHAAGLAATIKGLPLTYNKDLQEDKEPVFDAFVHLGRLLAAWTPMIGAIEPVPERMTQSLRGGHLTATDLADWLVRNAGVPFREAHHIVGRAVRAAEERGVDLSELDAAALGAVDARITPAACAALRPMASLEARALFGGPAPERARENIAAARMALQEMATFEPALPWAFALQPPAPWAL